MAGRIIAALAIGALFFYGLGFLLNSLTEASPKDVKAEFTIDR